MTNVTFSRFDAAEYLDTEEDIAACLDECARDGDSGAIALALGAVARARNVSKLAREVGITRTGLYKALSPGGNPSLDTVARVAKVMGFRLALVPISTEGAAEASSNRTIEARSAAWASDAIVEDVGIRREAAGSVETVSPTRERHES
jgi:probable addiction module antidote protein